MSVRVYGVWADTKVAEVRVYGVWSDVPGPLPAGEYVFTAGTWTLMPAHIYDGTQWTKLSMSDA